MWIEAAVLLLILALAYRFWWTAGPKQQVPANTARLYFFYTTWCGHSKKAMPEWEKVKAALASNPKFGSTTVEPVEVDGDKDRKTTSLYEVNGYPTIKLETSSGVYDFDRMVTADNVLAFLRKTLGEES
uniref:Thioredoxin domain-containing protein n=1 Tax=viral metagenome TaxID=1070528 RepID=A0A6C0AKT2_9ZZZZ